MTNNQILDQMGNVKKGKYVALKKKKDLGHGIVKISDLVIRLGVDYANMKVAEGKEVGGLPWGHWVEGLEGLVIEHKGNYYLRVANSYSNNGKSTYLLNDQEISKEEVVAILGEKKVEGSQADVYNIKFENILELSVN